MQKEKRTNIYLPEELKNEIKRAATKHRPPLTLSGFVRTAAVEKIDRDRKKNG